MSDLVKVKSVVKINPSLIADIKASAARALEQTAAALQTEVVQEIADFLVINNPLFASLMQRYDRGTEG